jgi:hypothetical protein
MQIVWAIKEMFPHATLSDFTVTINGDGEWSITEWKLSDQQPTKEEIEAYWNANQQAILDANKPAPSELDLLKAKQDLIQSALDDLILGGAL